MSRSKTTPIPGITRYAYHRHGKGYLARYYTHESVMQKLFSDRRYQGDLYRALHAAQRWLHAYAHAYEPRPRFRQRSGRTRTGRVGVCLRQKREKRGAAYWVYDVSYTVQGQRRTCSFRVHLFPSQEAAFQAACAFREARERDMQRERQQTLQRQWRDGEAVARLPHGLPRVVRPQPPGAGRDGAGPRLGAGPSKELLATRKARKADNAFHGKHIRYG